MSDPHKTTDELVEYFAGRKDLFTAYTALIRNGKRLERENADLKRQLSEANERTDDLIAAQIDAQAKLVKARQQVAEAQKDAERYRRLAKAGWIDDAIMKHYGITDGDKDSLDAAIDATKPKSEPGEQD